MSDTTKVESTDSGGGETPSVTPPPPAGDGSVPPALGRRAASIPPPLPPEARSARSSSAPPLPPPGKASVPPPPPTSSHSGIHRLSANEGESAALPPSDPAGEAELRQRLAGLNKELRGLAAHRDRVRLNLRKREDRVRELEASLAERDRTVARLERELAEAMAVQQRVPDDLKLIPGIGPGFERSLKAEGVDSYDQIAAWTSEDVERFAALINTKVGRIERDGWVEQARLLAARAPGEG